MNGIVKKLICILHKICVCLDILQEIKQFMALHFENFVEVENFP